MIDATVRMMATGDGVTGPINAGDPTEFSMLDLAKLVVDPTIRAGGSDDPRRRCPDIAPAQKQLSWAPRTALNEGLAPHQRLIRQTHVRYRRP